MTSFPHDFLWGAATAGHQVEGGNVNADLWPMEWATNSTFNEPSGDACDHYHRYPEDIAMLAELGSTRTGSPWSGHGSNRSRASTRAPHSTITSG